MKKNDGSKWKLAEVMKINGIHRTGSVVFIDTQSMVSLALP